MTKDEALRLALEAMEMFCEHGAILRPIEIRDAIKAALEAKDEPWEKFCDSHCVWTDHHPDCKLAKQEPVAWLHKETGLLRKETISSKGADWDENHWKPLYTNPPQRKPLTDEEILTYRYMIDWTAEWSYINFARAIEAAHGIKGKA